MMCRVSHTPPHVSLKVVREILGISGKELAALAGISASFLSEIESGKRGCTIETLKSLETALNLPPGGLTVDYLPWKRRTPGMKITDY